MYLVNIYLEHSWQVALTNIEHIQDILNYVVKYILCSSIFPARTITISVINVPRENSGICKHCFPPKYNNNDYVYKNVLFS